MTQEVQVTLTLEVDVTQEKGDIEKFIKELINTHTFHSSAYNRMVFDFIDNIEIKEEAEIYSSDEMNISLLFLEWYINSEYARNKILSFAKNIGVFKYDEEALSKIKRDKKQLRLELFNYFKNEIYKETN